MNMSGYLLPDGGPDDLPLLVLFAILLPPLPLRLLDGFLSEQQNISEQFRDRNFTSFQKQFWKFFIRYPLYQIY